MQIVLILGMKDKNENLIHKELIFDKAAEIDIDNIEDYSLSNFDYLCAEVNFTENGEIVIVHTLLDYEDLNEVNKFYDLIIKEFKYNGSNLIHENFISEDELIQKYDFESELYY